MHTVGNRRSGRTLMMIVFVALVVLLAALVWLRKSHQTLPTQKPLHQQTQMVNSTIRA